MKDITSYRDTTPPLTLMGVLKNQKLRETLCLVYVEPPFRTSTRYAR